ncbi:nuclear transport factor 2 family protein [Sphingomonas sp. SRS2]|uniref:nuclear transport factor 2 family protein n=1 Tax=Sphingomonas sp. SRS2 TaxID=133190 RepID=UPI0006183EE1|nr:nuclear transport factor 2 family protein [Sphingomonas sp. SRS2]KKC25570.1 polyketide cyclase [Sphingomonas sp. SRS2]
MDIELPRIIAEYFDADIGGSAEAVSRCFIESAVVKDEGNTYIGSKAIRDWKAASSRKYTYTVEPVAIATEEERIVVTSHLVGDFPGSPVDLRYFFDLAGGKIAQLEIMI